MLVTICGVSSIGKNCALKSFGFLYFASCCVLHFLLTPKSGAFLYLYTSRLQQIYTFKHANYLFTLGGERESLRLYYASVLSAVVIYVFVRVVISVA